MTERVFVSSTCYDLLDLRGEVEVHLRELGLTPILSDRATSSFVVKPDVNAIETCLVNVRDADHFICIISQRYGPSLGPDFGDISATHLEYREAKRLKKPLRVYVRDRTDADFGTWKANKDKSDLKLGWVKDSRQYRLFELLDEHRALSAEAPTTNWYWPFRDSVDLKERLTSDFGEVSRRAKLRRLIEEGLVPNIRPRLRGRNKEADQVTFQLEFPTYTPQPALGVALTWQGNRVELGDISMHQTGAASVKATVPPVGRHHEFEFRIELSTDRGHHIEDSFVLQYDAEASSKPVRFDHRRRRLLGGPKYELG